MPHIRLQVGPTTDVQQLRAHVMETLEVSSADLARLDRVLDDTLPELGRARRSGSGFESHHQVVVGRHLITVTAKVEAARRWWRRRSA